MKNDKQTEQKTAIINYWKEIVGLTVAVIGLVVLIVNLAKPTEKQDDEISGNESSVLIGSNNQIDTTSIEQDTTGGKKTIEMGDSNKLKGVIIKQ